MSPNRRAAANNAAVPIDLSPPPRCALAVFERLRGCGHEAFFVGGGVRDRLLGRPVKDWDIATSAAPEVVLGLFERTIPTGLQHGTVTVLSGELPIEVTTYRLEQGYSDGRRPDAVDFSADLRADLSRRDFTMNAMAWDPGERCLVDPFGGRVDLGQRLLRAVGAAVDRFTEDGLRPLRAVRFATVLDLRIEPGTERAIAETTQTFARVSPERVNAEWVRILESPRVGWGMDALEATGLLRVFLPEAVPDTEPADDVRGVTRWRHRFSAPPPSLAARLAVILTDAPDAADAALDRLRFPNAVRRRVVHLLGLRDVDPDLAVGERLWRTVARVGRDAWDDWLGWRTALDATAGTIESWVGLGDRVAQGEVLRGPLETRELPVSGRDVMDVLAAPPSRIVGEILTELLNAVWRDPTLNTRDRLLAHIPTAARARDDLAASGLKRLGDAP